MVIETMIISKESVKPYSSMPHQPNLIKFSIEDQPSFYVPLTLFYPMKNRASEDKIGIEKSQILKQSLAQTLASRFKSIDFEDGVHYVEARVKCRLSKFLKRHDIPMAQRLLPSVTSQDKAQPLAMIQVNFFECGGIAIGALFLYSFVDQIDLSMFLQDWASTARVSDNKAACPDFTTQYPLQKELNVRATCRSFLRRGIATSARLVFDSEAIASLKAISTSSRVQNPTAVEAVSALIWKCIMAALRANSGFSKPSLFTLSTKSCKKVAALCTDEYKAELDDLVHELRQAITQTSGYFSKRVLEDDGVDYIGCKNWCNNGLYEVDFGWARPKWVSSIEHSEFESLFTNNVVLIETRWGDGIEAWVTLDEPEMAILQGNKELLTFAFVNPSPLNVI